MPIDINNYYHKIVLTFEKERNEKVAVQMQQYMRNKFIFFGLKAPIRRALQRRFIQSEDAPTVEQIPDLIMLMWQHDCRELQLFAIDILDRFIKKMDASSIELMEQLITTKSWWDTVDLLAARHVGHLCKKFPELISTYPDKWIDSTNIWLQRTAILFQLKYKIHTDTALLFRYILSIKDSKEFFLQKGAGWALREYSKTNRQAVIDFINSNQLASLTKKESLKWLRNKGFL